MGLSQDELAEKVFVTRQAVSRWENGETTPNTETLKLLSKLFDVSINTLLGSPRQLMFLCGDLCHHLVRVLARRCGAHGVGIRRGVRFADEKDGNGTLIVRDAEQLTEGLLFFTVPAELSAAASSLSVPSPAVSSVEAVSSGCLRPARTRASSADESAMVMIRFFQVILMSSLFVKWCVLPRGKCDRTYEPERKYTGFAEYI